MVFYMDEVSGETQIKVLNQIAWKMIISELRVRKIFPTFNLIGYSMGGKFLGNLCAFSWKSKKSTTPSPDGIKTGLWLD